MSTTYSFLRSEENVSHSLSHSYNTSLLIMVAITSVTTNGVLQVFIGHINTNTPRVLIFY